MAHTFEFKVTVVLSRERGKFASRDDMAEALKTELEGMDPGGIYGIGADSDSDYTVDSWDADEL